MAPKKKEDEFPTMVPLSTIGDLIKAANSAVLLPDLNAFDGNMSTAEAKEWLRSVEKPRRDRKLERRTKARNSSEITNESSAELNLIDKWQRFSSRVQGDKEPAVEYIFEKLRLANEVDASIYESKGSVCAGLKSEAMASFLRGFDYNTLAEWSHRLREFENYKPECSIREQQNEASSFNATKSEKIKCFNCNREADHLARDCPLPKKPKFCTGCKTEGHGKKDCPKNSSED
ncbi:hypothetical protein U1Q18_050949 [Sarracenia purpurea var. burkii]